MTIIRIGKDSPEAVIVLLILLIIIILPSWKFVRYYHLPAKELKGRSKEIIYPSHFGCTVLFSCLTFIWLRKLDFSESIVNDHDWIVPLVLVVLLGTYGLIIGKIIDFFVVKRSDKRDSN